MKTEEKQRRLAMKRRQKRRRKRILRRLILWGYRIACVTIALAILLLAGKLFRMAEANGYYVEGSGSSWELMTTGATELGLEANQVIYDETHILAELESGNPIISIMGPGDFTTSGHFIVLTGVDEEGLIKICDPNSKINSEKRWNLEDLMPQIKNLWSYTYP